MAKSIGIHWESIFTRARAGTPDLAEQGGLLARVACLIDAANLREAHRRVGAGSSIGKLVLAGR